MADQYRAGIPRRKVVVDEKWTSDQNLALGQPIPPSIQVVVTEKIRFVFFSFRKYLN